MDFISWALLVVGVLEIILGILTMVRGARNAPADLPQETALRVARLKGIGYILVGVTFLCAFLGSALDSTVWVILCVVAAAAAVVLLWMSISARKVKPSNVQ